MPLNKETKPNPKGLEKMQKELKIRERIEVSQTTALTRINKSKNGLGLGFFV